MAKYYKLQETVDGVAAFYTVEDVEPTNGRDFSLEELQGYVDGLIEIVPLTDGEIMVVNEEGYINNLPLNPLATAIFRDATGNDGYIFGNVVICSDGQVL